jgi:hypothetical protein
VHLPDPIVGRQDEVDPEQQALLAEEVLTTGGFSRLARLAQPALVNGAAGVVMAAQGRPFSVVAFTVRRGKIAEIDVLADPARLRRLDLAALDD